MGPIQRQSLRVLLAGQSLGFALMTPGLIAEVLTSSGWPVGSNQVRAALSGTATKRLGQWTNRHSRTVITKTPDGIVALDKTVGWSITPKGIDAIQKPDRPRTTRYSRKRTRK